MKDCYFPGYAGIRCSIRAQRDGCYLSYAREGVRIHAEEDKIGSALPSSQRSYLSDYDLLQHRFDFMRKMGAHFRSTIAGCTLLKWRRDMLCGTFLGMRGQRRAITGYKFVPVGAYI
jgi:hypothetical protein